MKHLNAILLILYCSLIFWLSNQPILAMPISLPHIDKVIHAGAYFVMGILAWRAFSPRFPNPVWLTLLFCSFYGLSDEWHQSFIAGRYADIADWLADTIGAVFSVLLMTSLPALQKNFCNR